MPHWLTDVFVVYVREEFDFPVASLGVHDALEGRSQFLDSDRPVLLGIRGRAEGRQDQVSYLQFWAGISPDGAESANAERLKVLVSIRNNPLTSAGIRLVETVLWARSTPFTVHLSLGAARACALLLEPRLLLI